MDIDVELPFKVCLNLDRREDRRRSASEMFRMHHLKVLRWPALDGQTARYSRGFSSPSRRAKNLSFLQIIRRTRRLRARAALIFEDDVILHSEFRERVAALSLPDDWGLFYFGCLHNLRPTRVSEHVVRVTQAFDTHAVAVRNRHFQLVLSELRPKATKGTRPGVGASDVMLSRLQAVIPTYAALPNLAWQRSGASDLAGKVYSHYSETGEQLFKSQNVEGI